MGEYYSANEKLNLQIKIVTDTLMFLKQQSIMFKDANPFTTEDPVYSSCIKQMDMLLNALNVQKTKSERK